MEAEEIHTDSNTQKHIRTKDLIEFKENILYNNMLHFFLLYVSYYIFLINFSQFCYSSSSITTATTMDTFGPTKSNQASM